MTITRRRMLALVGTVAGSTVLRPPFSSSAQGGEGSGGWSDDLGGEDTLDIVTTVAPISSIVRNIGGDCVNIHGIVPDGADSHTFEPAPSDAEILANTDILIANGLDLEIPTISLAEAVMPEGAEVFTLGDKTIAEDEYAYDFSFPEEDGHPNPHLWTNVPFAIEYAELVAAKVAELDPDNADAFQQNLELYVARLEELDDAVHATVDSIPAENRKLLTYHDSWAYFAPNYGMEVIGAIQPSDFSEPSPREVAGLIDQIRDENVPAIFGSAVFPSSVLEQIANEGGAEYFEDLRDDEPPGAAGDPDYTYIGMMIKNLQIMAEALGGDPTLMDSVDPSDTYLPCD